MKKTKEQLMQDIKFLKEMVTVSDDNLQLGFKKVSQCKKHVSHDYIYSFATENILAGMDDFNLKDKNVCTVLGSGDQALSAKYYGAKKIVCFDINQVAKYYMDLKVAALKVLCYRDYLHFFVNHDDKMCFNYQVFSYFKQLLPHDSQLIWEEVYKAVDYQGEQIYHSSLFSNYLNVSKLEQVKQVIPYMSNEKNYRETQRKMGDFEYQFEGCDITLLPYMIDEKFDFLFLSNILEHLFDEKTIQTSEYEEIKNQVLNLSKQKTPNSSIPTEYVEAFLKGKGLTKREISQILSEFKDLLIEEMPNLLTEDGKIILYQLNIFRSAPMVKEVLKNNITVMGYPEGYQDYNQIISDFCNSISNKSVVTTGTTDAECNKIYFLQKPSYKKK